MQCKRSQLQSQLLSGSPPRLQLQLQLRPKICGAVATEPQATGHSTDATGQAQGPLPGTGARQQHRGSSTGATTATAQVVTHPHPCTHNHTGADCAPPCPAAPPSRRGARAGPTAITPTAQRNRAIPQRHTHTPSAIGHCTALFSDCPRVHWYSGGLCCAVPYCAALLYSVGGPCAAMHFCVLCYSIERCAILYYSGLWYIIVYYIIL